MLTSPEPCGANTTTTNLSPTLGVASQTPPTRRLQILTVLILGTGAASATNGEIRIGNSTTDSFSAEVPYYQNEARMFEREIKQVRGINGKKVRVIFDNQSSNPGAALNALNKAVEQEKLIAFIGPVKST